MLARYLYTDYIPPSLYEDVCFCMSTYFQLRAKTKRNNKNNFFFCHYAAAVQVPLTTHQHRDKKRKRDVIVIYVDSRRFLFTYAYGLCEHHPIINIISSCSTFHMKTCQPLYEAIFNWLLCNLRHNIYSKPMKKN